MRHPKPDCAHWNLWYGEEIEGNEDLGVRTLFVRKANISEIEKALHDFQINRIWFCKEYAESSSHEAVVVLTRNPTVKAVTEVTVELLAKISVKLRRKSAFFLKLGELPLDNRDFIAVGPAFEDESFKLGEGYKVTPENYEKDIRIL